MSYRDHDQEDSDHFSEHQPFNSWDGDRYGQFHHQNEEERPKFSTVLEEATALDHTAPYQNNLHYGTQPGEDWTCHDEPDGGKPRKEPPWLTHPDEHGAKKLPTAKHNEYDVLTYSEPTNGRGISDTKDFSKETCHKAHRLVSATITSEQWEGATQGTINKLEDVRFDNQGDITLPGGRRFTNYQIQCGKDTMACVVMEKGKDFGAKHVRRAFHESLEERSIVHLHRQTDH